MKMWKRLWQDDAGFIVSAELVLVATILVLGVMVGLNAVRNSVVSELADVAAAIDSTNQSYVLNGVSGHASASSGSTFVDNSDFCDDGDTANDSAQCVEQSEDPNFEGATQLEPNL